MKSAMILLAVVCLAVVLGGCEKFTSQNYDMITTGDSMDRVEDVLGKPDFQESDQWLYVHHSPYYQAKIYFKDGKVVDRKWENQQTFFKETPKSK